MFCIECGAPIDAGAEICPACGAVVVLGRGEKADGFQMEDDDARPLDNSPDPLAFGIANLILWIVPAIGLPVSVIGMVMSARRRKSVSLFLCIVGVVFSLVNAIAGAVIGGMSGLAIGILL